MIIQSKRVWFDEKWMPLQVEIEGQKIVNILPYGSKEVDTDFGNNRVLPGLIDIHTHGYNRNDTNHATKEWVREWCEYLPKEGVTSYVPSTSSCPKDVILNGMRAVADVMDEGYEGANILGIYSEGPFMCVPFHGAQPTEYLVVPTEKELDEYLEASKGHLIYCMCAPEMFNGDMSFIKYAVSKGIVVTCGHTGATFEDIAKAREAGATCFTHTFNGMRGVHHREPGVAGAAMYFEDMYAELIGDGIHVNKVVGKVLAKAKGKDKLITVTDSDTFKGLPVGEYVVDGVSQFVTEEGVVRLADGTLCGSTNKLNNLVRHQIEVAGIDEVTVINSATCNPCRLLHFDDHKGYIRVNYDADITVLDDNYQAVQTYVLGKSQL